MQSDQEHRLPPARRRLFEAILVCASLLVGYLVVEFAYRGYLYYTYAIRADYPVTIVDVRPPRSTLGVPGNINGPYPLSANVTRIQYGSGDRVVQRHQYHANNLGWVSRHDYRREKTADEYRIAVIGDSMTACINSTKTWADVLQRRLNEDYALLSTLGVKYITVLNLGVAGASMQLMANPLALIARRFEADTIVVNFPIEDLPRRHMVNFEYIPPEPPNNLRNDNPESPSPPSLVIDGVEIDLMCPSGPTQLSNPNCRVNPVWFVPPGREINSTELTQIKQKVARRLLLHRVLLTAKPLAILELLGTPVIPRAQAQTLPLTAQSGREDEDVEIALRALQFISRLSNWNMIAAHNPLYWHLTGSNRPAVLDRFLKVAAESGISIERMEEYMPTQHGEREWFRWYNLPHDGHWSDYGTEVYGEAMHRLLRARLFAARGITAPGESSCTTSYARFREGRAAAAKSDAAAALASFNDAVTQLPANAVDFARTSTAYGNCGFVADLYAERADLHERIGKPAAADWDAARLFSADPVALIKQRLLLRRARGEKTGELADLNEIVRLAPDDVDNRIDRGRLLLARGDYDAAIFDLDFALAQRPDSEVPLFYRAQTHMMAKDYEAAVADATRILAHSPDNAGVVFMRAGARYQLRQFDAALSDIEVAIRLMPNHKPFKQTRDNILSAIKQNQPAGPRR